MSPSITLPTEPTVSIRPQEGAEQAEEDEEAGHVARDVAGLVEARRDGIEQMPHRGLGDGHSPGALAAEDRRHRRQQLRVPGRCQAGVGDAEIVDPGDFGIEPDDLAEGQHDADEQHCPDQGIEPGIGEESLDDLLVEHHAYQRAQHQEDQHPHQEDAGRGQFRVLDIQGGAGSARRHGRYHPLRKLACGAHYGTAPAQKKRRMRQFRGQPGEPGPEAAL
ncbi:hypothetical protein ACVIM7_000336 [Bradyrhizobium liaoningense]